MVFGEGYDEALWLILHSDRKNRKEIVDFVNSIPNQMYVEMYKSINLVNRYIKNDMPIGAIDYNGLHGSFTTSDYLLYWYRVDPYSGELNLGYSIFDGQKYDEAYEMSLYLFDKKSITSVELIGNVECDKRTTKYGVSVGKEYMYTLKKTKIGYCVLCNIDNKEMYKHININKILNDNFVLDLRKFNGGNRLMRKKI